MSPEQIRGEPLDGRADVYSFGATCYEICTTTTKTQGRPPFRGTTSHELLHKHLLEKPTPPLVYNSDITEEFSDLVVRMLAKKKQDRPRDFHEVLMALRTMKVFKSEPSQAPAQ
jgi:serine/threonine protein kinase